jgi:hypothetical protein
VKVLTRALAVSLVALLLFEGSATAAVKKINTSIQIHSSATSVKKGKAVTFHGKLVSKSTKCKRNQTVSLYRGSTRVKNTSTNGQGHYSFKVKPSKTAMWKVKYAGRKFGVHPNEKKCLSSASRSIKVTVKK